MTNGAKMLSDLMIYVGRYVRAVFLHIAAGVVLFFLIVGMIGQSSCACISGLGRDISSMSDGLAKAHTEDRNK